MYGTAVAGVGTLVVVLLVGGGAPQPAPSGLPDAGPVTGWGLPIVRLVADVSAVAAIGFLLVAGVLLPRCGRDLDRVGLRAARRAGVAAAAWTLAAVAAVGFSSSSVLGRPVNEVLTMPGLADYAVSLPQARVFVVQALVAVTVAAFAGLIRTASGAMVLLFFGGAGMCLAVFTGHAAAADLQGIAIVSLLVHVLAVAVWVGSLGALIWVARALPRSLQVVVPRYSRLALLCIGLVAASGVLNALVYLPGALALVASGYGQLVLAKAAMLMVLAGFGWRHRRNTIPALTEQGHGSAFARLAAIEVAVMVATVALAVGLSRTPLPAAG